MPCGWPITCRQPSHDHDRGAHLGGPAPRLSNPEGNHGEDINDYHCHLGNTPTHSFMRGRDQPEYELVDTGIFNEGRYFDVFIEYAKASATDLLIRIRAINRGPDPAPAHPRARRSAAR